MEIFVNFSFILGMLQHCGDGRPGKCKCIDHDMLNI